MHFHRLCFVLPSDGDDNHPFDHHHTSKPPSKQRSCGVHLHDLLHNMLHRLSNSKRDIRLCGFCVKPPPAIFHDTDGVQFTKETSVGAHSPKTFTYSELYIATKGFSRDQILGSGGFGRVFRAVLPSDGTVAAVKCLTETGERFEKSFAAELVAVAHLRHRNLVPLRGWCVHDDQLLLVYDYMPNRSLDRLLFPRVGSKKTEVAEAIVAPAPPLNWERRMKIVKGLAAALFYLHEQLEAQIIHRDVKTSNVMLDSNFNARLGDFGLARWMEHELGYDTRSSSTSNNSLRLADTTGIGGTIGTTTTGNTEATTTTITASFGFVSSSSTAYATANEESLYITAEKEHGDNSGGGTTAIATAQLSRRQLNPFLMVEPPREITYKEIISATENFSDSNRLSEVDFGTAYYGVLDNHDIIVKRLGMKTCPALRFRFANELTNLGRLRHRNLIQLRGWCTEQGEMLVVYDYSANRLLGQLLSHHNHRKSNFLQWNHRYNIVKSLACAIRYLHEEWEEQVIHRNITSSAIYIDSDMNPRLGSFALAEFLTRNEHGHHVVIDKKVCVRGIFGYMAPEYMENGEATPMADVYSFGVVMLEVVTGRMAVDFRRPEVLLVKKIHEFESRKGSYEELVDPRLDGEYDQKELQRVVKLAMACTQSDPNSRPTMTRIVSILDGNDRWLIEEGLKESVDEWKQRNLLSLSLIRRIQALGIQ
ncbi:hypothetical protein E3N88_42864 [Mikania micrantha]|uniref:Protein kinase domain-containing protein n=1 Tax=Mikania micrantha TaxID=192012 RepID=A0A5N6LGI2_9ASTR|nr:hypothetical protein E3N88_42864 [Mikania micrantha]